MIKRGPKPTKFCRHDYKDLVNMSTEGIEESLHEKRGIEQGFLKNAKISN